MDKGQLCLTFSQLTSVWHFVSVYLCADTLPVQNETGM